MLPVPPTPQNPQTGPPQTDAFAAIDTNGDGVITREQFVNSMVGRPQSQAVNYSTLPAPTPNPFASVRAPQPQVSTMVPASAPTPAAAVPYMQNAPAPNPFASVVQPPVQTLQPPVQTQLPQTAPAQNALASILQPPVQTLQPSTVAPPTSTPVPVTMLTPTSVPVPVTTVQPPTVLNSTPGTPPSPAAPPLPVNPFASVQMAPPATVASPSEAPSQQTEPSPFSMPPMPGGDSQRPPPTTTTPSNMASLPQTLPQTAVPGSYVGTPPGSGTNPFASMPSVAIAPNAPDGSHSRLGSQVYSGNETRPPISMTTAMPQSAGTPFETEFLPIPQQGPFASMPAGSPPGPFASTPAGQPLASGAAPPPPDRLGPVCTLQITRLLDMPVWDLGKGPMGGKIERGLKVRVFDSEMREVNRTSAIFVPLASQDPNIESETIDVPPNQGVLELRSDSRFFFVQAEFADMVGTRPIGKCRIHRLDNRSNVIWPYILSNQYDKPVNCGIELSLHEGPKSAAPIAFGSTITPPMMPSPGMPPPGMVPPVMPVMMPPMMTGTMPPPMMTSMPSPQMAAAMGMPNSQGGQGLVAVIEIDSVKDMPYPKSAMAQAKPEIVINILADHSHGHVRELQRLGPFDATRQTPQGSLKELAEANCAGQRAKVEQSKAQVHFTPEAPFGAMFIIFSVEFGNKSRKGEPVGATLPIPVTVDHVRFKYYELRQRGTSNQVMGGITISHRLVPEAEVDLYGLDKVASSSPTANHDIRAPVVEIPFNVHARPCQMGLPIPPYSLPEAEFIAAQNAEAQNRALLQRCKMADPKSDETSGVQKWNGPYREWANLDAVFSTMGPNPLAMDDAVGPGIVRGYKEETSVLKEVAPLLGPNMMPLDQKVNEEIMAQMCNTDPMRVKQGMRPVVCKDPQEIVKNGTAWLPDPPLYMPIKNMDAKDKETLRLACYTPEQCAKLSFLDVNPNYVVGEDIWAACEAEKEMLTEPIRRPPGFIPKRVKDECPLA